MQYATSTAHLAFGYTYMSEATRTKVAALGIAVLDLFYQQLIFSKQRPILLVRRTDPVQNVVDATDNNKNLHPTLRPRVGMQVLERRSTSQTELLHELLEAHAFGDV